MKLEFAKLLPEVEIVTDSEHGEIVEVYFDGDPVADISVADFVMRFIGEEKWRELVILETEKATEAMAEEKEIIL